MDLNLNNKRAFVGGGSKGIGFAAAQELALLGATVTLASRSEKDLQKAVGLLACPNHQKHQYLVVDYSDIDNLKTKVSHLIDASGNFHILINNTGGPAGGPIEKANNDEFSQAFTNHLLANHTLVQLMLDGMKADNYGRIINVISTSVKVPLTGLGVSNTIRGAVANWSKTMANELGAYGITVNNVLPGATATGRLDSIIENKMKKLAKNKEGVTAQMLSKIPLNRFAQPEEVGAAVAFLASPSAAYINGVNLPVDGGRTGSL